MAEKVRGKWKRLTIMLTRCLGWNYARFVATSSIGGKSREQDRQLVVPTECKLQMLLPREQSSKWPKTQHSWRSELWLFIQLYQENDGCLMQLEAKPRKPTKLRLRAVPKNLNLNNFIVVLRRYWLDSKVVLSLVPSIPLFQVTRGWCWRTMLGEEATIECCIAMTWESEDIEMLEEQFWHRRAVGIVVIRFVEIKMLKFDVKFKFQDT